MRNRIPCGPVTKGQTSASHYNEGADAEAQDNNATIGLSQCSNQAGRRGVKPDDVAVATPDV